MAAVSDRPTLVTGGAGYVGSVLVDALLASGRRVRVLDSLLHGDLGSLASVADEQAFEFVRGDVRDQASRLAALDGCSEVVHLAAIVGDPACARDETLARETNLEATEALVRDAKSVGVDRFVFLSTCSNYGKLEEGGLATETWALNPLSTYAETKVAAEMAVLSNSGNGYAATCLRLATVYGTSPRMRFDLTVNEFTRDALLSRGLVVYGEQFWRPYVHVRDAARAISAVLDAPVDAVRSEVFNVGNTNENYRKLDIVEMLQDRVPGTAVDYVHRDEDPRDYRVSFEKIGAALGYETRHTVSDGIDEVIELLQSRRIEDPFSDVYRN